MSSVNWRHLSGDTSSFAIEFTLLADDVDDWMVDAEDQDSWGTLTLWVNGRNVCEHTAQAETLHSAHWYLLPILEWLVTGWDALLHEERLPVVNDANTAARGFQRAAVVAETDAASGGGDESAIAVQQWAYRHSLRSAAPGALLPDLYLRRFGDHIELSIGTDPLPGQGWGLVFTTAGGLIGEIRADDVAATLFDAIDMLVTRLRRTHPEHGRYRALAEELDTIGHESREASRLAWLAGAGGDIDAFHRLWAAVNEAIPVELQAELAEQTQPPQTSPDNLVMLAPPAALLFGSLAPEVSARDIADLYATLLTTKATPDVADRFAELGAELEATLTTTGLTPGEEGSLYGEEAWHRLVPNATEPVNIHAMLSPLGVGVDHVELADINLRAVTMVGLDGSARIVVNRSFRLGTSEAIERFTLAHELAHLILDQDHASAMIVASGPWAPKAIEQRASAFAAAFLIPAPLLNVGSLTSNTWSRSAQGIRDVARALKVSFTALVSRLQNLGRLSQDEADSLREPRE